MANDDIHLRGMQVATRDLRGTQAITLDRNVFERADQLLERQTGVNQRAEYHIPADSGKAVEVKPGHEASFITSQ